MKPTKIYLPIKVEDEFPDKSLRPIMVIERNSGRIDVCDDYPPIHYYSHWLKPVERFVFTQDELNKVVKDAFEAGKGYKNEKNSTTNKNT